MFERYESFEKNAVYILLAKANRGKWKERVSPGPSIGDRELLVQRFTEEYLVQRMPTSEN